MKPSIGKVVLHLKFYCYTYLLCFAEADSYCFCIYFSPQFFILSIHLEQAMAETTKKNHRRARPLTRRTLEGCWTWTKHALLSLLSICCKSASKRILGGKGTRFESYITCYVAPLNEYVMYYIDFPNNYIRCHVTRFITTYTCYIPPLLHNTFLFSYITCYIQRNILFVNCICKMFYWYITFSLTWFITGYICCIILLRNKGGT